MSGWVKTIHSFGSEVGMDDNTRARPDIFFPRHGVYQLPAFRSW
jgi:hypothetical protein